GGGARWGGAGGAPGEAGGPRPVACGDVTPVPAAERVPNGNPLLPPKWAFGVLFGSYYDQGGTGSLGDLLDAATKLRSSYSGDLMWIDSNWLSSSYDGAT